MSEVVTSPPLIAVFAPTDEWLFGWDDTPAIVSVWADRRDHALVWQRLNQELVCSQENYRPFLVTTALDDVLPLGSALAPAEAATAETRISYRELESKDEVPYSYLLSPSDYRLLEQTILPTASRRWGAT